MVMVMEAIRAKPGAGGHVGRWQFRAGGGDEVEVVVVVMQ